MFSLLLHLNHQLKQGTQYKTAEKHVEVLRVITIINTVFGDVIPCSLVDKYQNTFAGTCQAKAKPKF